MKTHDANSPRLPVSTGAFHTTALISHGTPRDRRISNVLVPTVCDTAMSPSPEREQKESQNFHPGESSTMEAKGKRRQLCPSPPLTVHVRRIALPGKECRKVLTFAQLCYCYTILLIGSISKIYQNFK